VERREISAAAARRNQDQRFEALKMSSKRSALERAGHPRDTRFGWRGGIALRGLKVLMLLLLLGASHGFGAARSSNRYLLVFETSNAMQRRLPATLEAVAALLGGGFRGQLRDGDTVGVWTFNETLETGRLPLQHWSSVTSGEVTREILGFLKSQKHRGGARFDQVRPGLEQVIQASELITVILFTSGQEAMAGTPFDQKINEVYAAWREVQQKERKPFVTVLRARQGKIVFGSASPAPWPVEIPSLPAPKPAKTVRAEPPKAEPPKPVVVGPPLIVTGKKPPVQDTTTPPPPTTPAPATTPVPSEAPAQPVTDPAVKPAPETPSPTAAPATAQPGAVPAPAPSPAVSSTLAQPALTPAPATTPPAEAPAAAPAPVPVPVPVPEAKPVTAPPPAAPSPAPVAPTVPPSPAAAPAETPAPTAATVTEAGPPEAVQVGPAVAVAAPGGGSRTAARLLIPALILLAAVLLIALWWLRRSRRGTGASLITRSLDRK